MVERSEYEAPLLVIYNAIYEVRMMLEEIGMRMRLRKGYKEKKRGRNPRGGWRGRSRKQERGGA